MNIKEILEAFDNFLQDKFPLNEMANFSKDEFNLPVNVWVDGPRNLKHSKRIKFQNNYSNRFDETDLITLTISDDPQVGKTFKKIKISNADIEVLKKWVVLNKDILLQYSNGDMSTSQLIKLLKAI